jgi:putative phosphoesterase
MHKLGLISDSHGKADLTRQAAELLVSQGAQALLHMGDICSLPVIDALVTQAPDGGQVPVHLTWGNNDPDDDRPGPWTTYAQSLGITVHHPTGILFPDANPVGFTHGHIAEHLESLIQTPCRFILHGHTHQRRDVQFQGARIINPGALYRVDKPTVALLDIQTGHCRFFELFRK